MTKDHDWNWTRVTIVTDGEIIHPDGSKERNLKPKTEFQGGGRAQWEELVWQELLELRSRIKALEERRGGGE
jgi:hypothetical protein